MTFFFFLYFSSLQFPLCFALCAAAFTQRKPWRTCLSFRPRVFLKVTPPLGRPCLERATKCLPPPGDGGVAHKRENFHGQTTVLRIPLFANVARGFVSRFLATAATDGLHFIFRRGPTDVWKNAASFWCRDAVGMSCRVCDSASGMRVLISEFASAALCALFSAPGVFPVWRR